MNFNSTIFVNIKILNYVYVKKYEWKNFLLAYLNASNSAEDNYHVCFILYADHIFIYFLIYKHCGYDRIVMTTSVVSYLLAY